MELKFLNECYDVLNHYSGSNYKYINNFLLMDQDEEKFKKKYKHKNVNSIKDDIKQLDKCFEKAKVTKDDKMVVYRGMTLNLGLEIGESLLLKNFTSTSSNLGISREFTEVEYNKKGDVINECCLYRLHIGKGIPYIPMDRFSKLQAREKEILLPRNLIMTYLSDETYKSATMKYKIIIRNIKITKLNDEIKNNIISDMGEPMVDLNQENAEKKEDAAAEKKALAKKKKEEEAAEKKAIAEKKKEEAAAEKKAIAEKKKEEAAAEKKAIAEKKKEEAEEKKKLLKKKKEEEAAEKKAIAEKKKEEEAAEKKAMAEKKREEAAEKKRAIAEKKTKKNRLSVDINTGEKRKRCLKGTRKNKQGICE